MEARVCVIVGVGPGLGEALARKFSTEGYRVALPSRREQKLAALASELDGVAVACDATDPASIRAALAEVRRRLGPVHTLLWNVGSAVWGDLDTVDEDGMELAWRTNALGLFAAAKAAVADMRAAGEGAIIVTGATASRRGKPLTTAFAAGKAAQRSLCQSLARQLWPEGVHVALMIIDAGVGPRGGDDPGKLDPNHAARTAFYLTQQPRSAWTFGFELRPHVERW